MTAPRIPRRRAPIVPSIPLGGPAWHEITPLRIVRGIILGLVLAAAWAFLVVAA